MNPLELSAMLDKIREAGGVIELKDGQPIARNVPANFLAHLKTHREEVIKMLQNRSQVVSKRVSVESNADVLKMIDNTPKVKSCKTCKYGNDQFHYACLEPVKSGLSDKFSIVWHDHNGQGCKAFMFR